MASLRGFRQNVGMPTPNDAKNPAVFLLTVLSTTKRAGAFLDLLVIVPKGGDSGPVELKVVPK